jgi:hypothetical protein
MKPVFFQNWQSCSLFFSVLLTSVFSPILTAQAAPQLRYQTLEDSGNPQSCLQQAQQAMRAGGFSNPATRNQEVVGENRNGELTATIYCQRLQNRGFQAIIMVAGSENVAPAMLNRTLKALRQGMNDQKAAVGSHPGSGQSPMSNQRFEQFLSALEDSWPNYVEFLQQPARKSYFTSEQVREIITRVGSTREVAVAVLLYPRVVDPENWFIVEQAITFNGDRRELRERLSGD